MLYLEFKSSMPFRSSVLLFHSEIPDIDYIKANTRQATSKATGYKEYILVSSITYS